MRLDNLIANSVSGYTARYEMLNGRQHVIVPVVMLVEGVHSGSAGNVFYPAEEIAAFPLAWNGRPVTIMHPTDDSGYISGNTPEALLAFAVGQLFNTYYDSDTRGLRSELWIDVARGRQLSPEVMGLIASGAPIEVSTGLWFDDDGGAGSWNGEEFETTARDFRPDHLALLPGSTGACSVADGCGVRANQGGDMKPDEGKGLLSFLKEFLKKSETKAEIVGAIMERLSVNKPGLMGTVRAIQRAVDALDKETPQGWIINFLEDAFEDGTFVMRQMHPQNGETLWSGTYTIQEDGTAELGDDMTQVREVKEFVAVANEDAGGSEPDNNKRTQKEDATMSAKEALVGVLIDCDRSHFAETHREYLMGLEVEALEALKPEPVKEEPTGNADGTEEPAGDKTPPQSDDATPPDEGDDGEPDAGDGTPAEEEEPDALLKFIEQAPPEHRKVLEDAVKGLAERKEVIIKSILEHPGNKFSEEALGGKLLDELEALASLITKPETDDADGKTSPDTEVTGNVEESAPLGRPVLANFVGRVGAASVEPDANDEPPMGRPSVASLVGEQK